ncbi:MAG TPA: aminopeptidase [Herpetosiphonaceae bacterium]
MADPRLAKLADTLVSYSLNIKPEEVVVIRTQAVAMPLIEELYRAILQAGAYPMVDMGAALDRVRYTHASEQQLRWISPFDRFASEQADVRISIDAATNTRDLSGVDPARQAIAQGARRELMSTFMRRSAEGSLRWCVTLFPTEAFAQDADMSLSDFEDFVYDACFLNDADPVASWRKLQAEQQRLVDYLEGKREIRLVGDGTDLTLGVAGRRFINCAGDSNFPDGEFFTGPEETKVNGTVRFSFPAVFGGRQVEDVRLTFEDGAVVKATAQSGQEYLEQMLNLDEGARRLGEFAFGNNPNVRKYTRNILFDEKMGGTVHMALGAAYPETGGLNQSALHWDMVCDLRQGGEVYVDGVLFAKDGKFVV